MYDEIEAEGSLHNDGISVYNIQRTALYSNTFATTGHNIKSALQLFYCYTSLPLHYKAT